ncbi:MAG: HEPN domain-containing protein [Calditrichota bacterium]
MLRDKESLHRLIVYWTSGADEDFIAAESLVRKKLFRQGLFFAHLCLEKYLKALIIFQTGEDAPYIHNLLRLAEIAELKLEPIHDQLLRDFNIFNIVGRYPWQSLEPITAAEAKRELKRAKEFKDWLKNKYLI